MERGRVRWVVGGCGGCSVLVVTGVGFHRYPGVLITIALHVLVLGVECVAVECEAEVAAHAGEGEVGVGPAALLRREWGGVGGEDGEREAAGARIGSGRRGTGAGERDEGELAREREELAIAFICDGGAGRRGCRGSSAAV